MQKTWLLNKKYTAEMSDQPSSSCNSYNSLQGLSGADFRRPLNKHMKLILEFLHSQETPISAQEIAEKTGLNRNTVRSFVRRLLAHDLISQPYYGYYIAKQKLSDKITQHSDPHMGIVKVTCEPLPRVHNLRLRVDGVKKSMLNVRGSFERRLGDVKIVFINCGGSVTTVTVAYNKGLDMEGWGFVRDFILLELGVARERVTVVTAHLGNDFQGFRIDGAQAWTLTAFDGMLERFYNKGDGVRHEIQLTRPTTLAEMESMLKGNSAAYNVTAAQLDIQTRMEGLTEAVKGGNQMSAEQTSKLSGVLEQLLTKMDKSQENLRDITLSFEKSMNEHLGIIQVFKKESEQRSRAYDNNKNELVQAVLDLKETVAINTKVTLTLSSLMVKRRSRRRSVKKKKHGVFHGFRKRFKF